MKAGALNDGGAGLVYRGSMTFRRDSTGVLSFESVPIAAGRITVVGVRYHVTDHLGSVRGVVDGTTGNLLEASDYEAYGLRSDAANLPSGLSVSTPSAGEAPCRYHYTGQEDQGPVSITVAPNASAATVPYTDFGARHYSPALRRWMVPDPLNEQYYDVSPYAYCAGDPVNLVDPNGATIYIGQYYYDDGLLYDWDHMIMDLDEMDDFTRSAYEALQELSKTNTGKVLISNLETTDFIFTIRRGEDSMFKADSGGEACGFGNQALMPDSMKQLIIIGSGGTVYWNEQGTPLVTTDGIKISPVTDLGHELAHAEDASFGLQDNRNYSGLSRNEWQASYKENLLRKEMKQPLRLIYHTNQGESIVLLKNGHIIKPDWYE